MDLSVVVERNYKFFGKLQKNVNYNFKQISSNGVITFVWLKNSQIFFSKSKAWNPYIIIEVSTDALKKFY